MKKLAALALAFWPIFLSAQTRDTFFGLDGKIRSEDDFEKRLTQKAESLIGSLVKNFAATDALGRAFSLSDFEGRPVLLYFGDVWHDGSLAHFEGLGLVFQKFQARGLRVVAVTANGPTDFEERGVAVRKMGFPFLTGASKLMFDDALGAAFGYPRVILVNESATIEQVFWQLKNGSHDDFLRQLEPSILQILEK